MKIKDNKLLRYITHYPTYKLFRNTLADNNYIILITIPKSGTIYFRLLLTNYLHCLYVQDNIPIGYSEMHNEIFPNVWDEVVRNKHYKLNAPNEIIKRTGYNDFQYSHEFPYIEFIRNSKIIFLYRNPLDFIVSYYFYKKDRLNVNVHHRIVNTDSPNEIPSIDYGLDYFTWAYSKIKNRLSNKNNVLKICYENLLRKPITTMEAVLSFLQIDIHNDKIERAVEFSSKKYIIKEEEKLGHPIHAPEGKKNSFIRSGKIGNWKEHFSSDNLKYIEMRLNNNGIRLDEFIIE